MVCMVILWPANSAFLFVCILFCATLLINILICNILRSQAIQHETTFAASTELLFCYYYDFLTPKRAIQEDLVIDKQDFGKR